MDRSQARRAAVAPDPRVRRAGPALRALRLAALLLLPTACHAPASIESTVEFETARGIVRGVATEDGVFALAEIVPVTGEVSFRCRTGNGFYDDVATLVRRNETLAVLTPKSSHLNLARFATHPAARDDRLFVEVRHEDRADLLACHLLEEGQRGDLLVLDERQHEFADIVVRYAGAGVFVWREKTMQLVGMLNGVYCEDPKALAFVGLDEMATLLPATSDYFVRRELPRRADFEFGVPRSFAGERPAASGLTPAGEAPPAATPPAPPSPSSATGKDH